MSDDDMQQYIKKPPLKNRLMNQRHPLLAGGCAIIGDMSNVKPLHPDLIEDPLEVLLARVAGGEQPALGELYDATVSRVYGLAMKITLRKELAEEVVGDVFLQVWRKAASYDRKRASAAAWLMLICRSRAIDLLRREQRARKGKDPLDEKREVADSKSDTPMEASFKGEFAGHLQAAMDSLPEIQRQMISLAFFRGLSHQEVAVHTSQPLGTVKSHLRRAQISLRKILNRNGIKMEAYCE